MDRAITLRSDLDVDLAVIGAGAAGLLMASAAARQGRRLRLVVLEPRRLAPNPRLWVFPARPGHALERLVSQRLARVCIDGLDRPLIADRLDVVRAADLQSAALDQLAAGAGRIEDGVRIDAVQPDGEHVILTTSRGDIRASGVIDTRPGAVAAVRGGCWTQISWFVQAPSAPIAPGFAISKAEAINGAVFMSQSLALNDGRALLECVGFCPPGDRGDRVKARLLDRLDGLGVAAEEASLRRAVMPLDAAVASEQRPGPVIHAPAGAGGLRFGPGRTALRLARWASMAARRFARDGRLSSPPLSTRTERKMTAALAGKLSSTPGAAAAWINSGLLQADADAALRFLAAAPRSNGFWPWGRGEREA